MLVVWNGIGIGILLIVLLSYLIYKLRNPLSVSREKKNVEDLERYSMKQISRYIKDKFNEMTGANLYDLALDLEDFNRQKHMRTELKAALKGCNSGDLYDKMYVKDLIYDLLLRDYGLDERNINYVLPFEEADKLTARDKFDILMQLYKKKHNYKALPRMIEEYRMDELKAVIEGGQTESYIITEDEINKIYREKARGPVSFEDKMQVIVQRIYQGFKGFGVIDEIRYMEIDGVSGGVSGIPAAMRDIEDEEQMLQAMRTHSKQDNTHSVWIMYRGKTIHLSFLSFGSELELKRICQSIYKWNNPGQLTEQNGFIVNDMKDHSRIVVMRPPFAESWVFFNRKFNLTYTDLENFLNPKDRGYAFDNTELPIRLIPFLMKGARVTTVTGDQGTGKSTLMMAMARYIAGYLTIRVQEMAFELHLRNLFPQRNIVSIRETADITGQKGMDIQKKTDGAVNIIGEAATAEQVAWFLQAGTVASLFTILSHHAKTFRDLVFSLRNSTLQTGLFRNESIAEQQVVSVLDFDIHLFKDAEGRRYIERITECVPMMEQDTYPQEPEQAAIEFYRRMTDRKTFEGRDIVVFQDGGYIAKHPISERQQTEMMRHMNAKDRTEFEELLAVYWKVPA
ncbi:CpaF/VirB11 family protein [Paenibacillus sp. P96]|uniref:CpaF/VirB11 family protein n=1 Tax=Paenibacillus zeirhizosphaerae TaxID=2987519 RepID=A0ABT9FKP2_9BACL|nr:pilus assembly protein CpaF [Paenibacillus sp. P96]MDP4095280.1 CpaF/VirB11 family protein [Paenibacillus sp. P96]